MSRLRNRMTRAEFWTDPELLSWHRDKREFYQKLRSAAEDSGCEEDSPFGWMCLFYTSPLDRDISLEQVTRWRDELIAAGKLIRYNSGGKDYLYQTTFHGHEHPRNPQAPSIPLPSWVKWVPNKDDGRKGRYEVKTRAGWTATKDLHEASEILVQPSKEPCSAVEETLYEAATTPPAQPCPAQPSPDLNGGQPVDNSPTPVDNSAEAPVEPEEPRARLVYDTEHLPAAALEALAALDCDTDDGRRTAATLAGAAHELACRVLGGAPDETEAVAGCVERTFEGLKRHAGEIRRPAAYMRTLAKAEHIGDLVGDAYVLELRNGRRFATDAAEACAPDRDPKPLGACLPPGFAQPMPKQSDEAAS